MNGDNLTIQERTEEYSNIQISIQFVYLPDSSSLLRFAILEDCKFVVNAESGGSFIKVR